MVQDDTWLALVECYNSPAQRFVRRWIDDPRIVEDVVQTAWESLHVYLQRGGQIKHFEALFYTILHRRTMGALRTIYRLAAGETCTLDSPARDENNPYSDVNTMVATIPDHEPSITDLVAARMDRVILEAALATLNQRDQVLVRSRVWLGLSNRKVTHLLLSMGLMEPGGDEEKRAENYYYRALIQLRRRLEPQRHLLSA